MLFKERAHYLENLVDKLKSSQKQGHENASQEYIDATLRELAVVSMEGDFPYLAVRAYRQLMDVDGLRKASNLALQKGDLSAAISGFNSINDKEGLRRCLVQFDTSGGTTSWLLELIPTDLGTSISEGFQRYCDQHGFKFAPEKRYDETVNAAYELAPKYDFGVAVARGGLFSAYLFEQFGLPTVIAETKRRGKGAMFKWHSNPDLLKGKKVIVLEEDVCSGRTMRRVIRELQRIEPCKLDLYLNIDPNFTSHNKTQPVPEGFGKVYQPEELPYRNLLNGIEHMYERLK